MAEYRNALPTGYQLQEYVMEAVLGQGGFGVTYLAHDTLLDQKAAIKEYLPNDSAVRDGATVAPRSSADAETYRWGLDRFLLEARTLARFRHKNIVRVLRFFEANGTAYAVMEYENGDSLSSVLKDKGGTMAEAEILSMLYPLLDGLRVIHDGGFIHRDIKPGNIFIRREDGSPVLIDFGSARDHQSGRELTTIATPGYAPFEQYFADGNQGPWSDIYAMAGVAYRAITGSAPADAASRLKKDPMVPLVEAAKGRYSHPFLEAVDWALRMDEKKRPQNVDAWIKALERSTPAAVSADAATAAPKPAVRAEKDAPTERTTVLRDSKASWGKEKEAATTKLNPQQQQASGGGMGLVIGGVIAVALLGGGAYAFFGGSAEQPKAPPAAAAAAPAQPAAAEKSAATEIAELMALADADFVAGRLDAPQDGNAVDRYKKVLAIMPEHPGAKAAMGRVADRYVDLAEKVAEKDLDKAKEYVDRAAAIRGEANVKEARDWLADLQRSRNKAR